MPDAVIAGYVRTPIGRYAGALASVRPDTLAAHAIRSLVEQTGIDPADVDDVILGCANQDQLALLSQQKAARAMTDGRLAEEIVPTPVPQPKGEPLLVSQDEHPRPNTS